MRYNLDVKRPYEHLLSVWQEILEAIGEVDGEKLVIRQALAEDGLLLDLREEQLDTFKDETYDSLVRIHAWLMMLSPMNYTLFHGDKLLMMMSVIPVANGVAEISFLTDNNFVNSSKNVKRNMIGAFRQATDFLPFRRLQAKVKKGFDIGARFVEMMGFLPEGILQQFGPEGDDYVMYAKLR